MPVPHRDGRKIFFVNRSAMNQHGDHKRDSGEREFAEEQEPFLWFARWFKEAEASEPIDPNAMALATVDAKGKPNVRMVLLKDAGPQGFVFYTNSESAKGTELAANPDAALLLYWKSLNRQIRVRGPVEKVSDAEADAYFASRHRSSRIGAWASSQSRPLPSRAALLAAAAREAARFGLSDIPRPPYWHGYRLTPLEIEFWQSGAFRLHDRVVFRRTSPLGPWAKTRLYP
jgi:pyridoxamine 5'-phosphate oxidase